MVDLQTETSQNIYRSTQLLQEYNRRPVREELNDFAEHQVYPEDRERYLEFMDLDTVEQRLEESPAPFISAPFRMRTVNGDYVWQLNLLLYAGDKRERKIMCCSRLIDNNNIPVLVITAKDAFDDMKLGFFLLQLLPSLAPRSPRP